MALKSEKLSYTADDLEMESTLYWDDARSGRRPGVLVFPEAFGLGEHAKGSARKLASEGYAALACDLHGHEMVIGDLGEVMPLLGPLFQNPVRTRARAQGGMKALMDRPEVDASKIAAIGYCFGGTMALELGRSGAPIKAIVGFHSGLGTALPQDAKNIKGKVLVCIGADDPGIPPEQRAAFEQEMRDGKVEWRMHLYGNVVHSFTNPEAVKLNNPDFARYDENADKRSYGEMISLFNEVFK